MMDEIQRKSQLGPFKEMLLYIPFMGSYVVTDDYNKGLTAMETRMRKTATAVLKTCQKIANFQYVIIGNLFNKNPYNYSTS